VTDREMILDTMEAILADACRPEIVRPITGGLLEGLWKTLVDLGFTSIGVDEEDGGSGGSFGDAIAVTSAAASRAAPVPLAETLLASQVAAAAGFDLTERTLTFAGAGEGMSIERLPSGARLRGRLPRVPWARIADLVVLVSDPASAVVIVDPAECALVEHLNLAGEPRDDVQLAVDVDASSIRELPDDWTEDRLAAAAAMFRAAQIAGALQAVRELTITHVNEREQFKRTIGSFQAVQHQTAVLAGITTAIAAASEAAAASPESAIAAAAAKTYASHACGAATMIAHELHGAIGFTAEHQLQLFTRRIWSWREECGNETYWAARLGRSLIEGGASAAWGMLTAR
jgi:acyl-CoA dehydrogenase